MYWKPAKAGIGSGKPVPKREAAARRGEEQENYKSADGVVMQPQYDGIPQEYAMRGQLRPLRRRGVYLHQGGVLAAKRFVRDHMLSRKVEVSADVPVQAADEGAVEAVHEGSRFRCRRWQRLLAETGRHLRGLPCSSWAFSRGGRSSGKARGGSLDEARIRAAISALKGWYLYSPPGGSDNLPSLTYEDEKAAYQPSFIDVGEVVI